MHAWAALKPADIVSAARAFRDIAAGAKPGDDANDAPPGEATPSDDVPAGGSAPAE